MQDGGKLDQLVQPTFQKCKLNVQNFKKTEGTITKFLLHLFISMKETAIVQVPYSSIALDLCQVEKYQFHVGKRKILHYMCL